MELRSTWVSAPWYKQEEILMAAKSASEGHAEVFWDFCRQFADNQWSTYSLLAYPHLFRHFKGKSKVVVSKCDEVLVCRLQTIIQSKFHWENIRYMDKKSHCCKNLKSCHASLPFTNICKRIGLTVIGSMFQQVSLWNFFPSRYSRIQHLLLQSGNITYQ